MLLLDSFLKKKKKFQIVSSDVYTIQTHHESDMLPTELAREVRCGHCYWR